MMNERIPTEPLLPGGISKEQVNKIRKKANEQVDTITEKWASDENKAAILMTAMGGMSMVEEMFGEEKVKELIGDMITVFLNAVSNKVAKYADLDPKSTDIKSNN